MKIRSIILFAATIGLLLSACTKHPAKPEFGFVAIDTLIGAEPLTCHLDYRFATITNAEKSPVLEAIEAANIRYFFELENFAGTAAEAAAEAIRETADERKFPANAATGSLPSQQDEISVESEGEVVDTLLCYTINRWSFTGGAHGSYDTEYHTYSLGSGDELSTADIFTKAQTERLPAAIRAKLYELYEVKDDAGLTGLGFFPEYIGLTENFLITPGEVTFYYNPYEIGCYALGPVEVSFTREELEKMR